MLLMVFEINICAHAMMNVHTSLGSRTSVEELTRECRICEALTWLEVSTNDNVSGDLFSCFL